MDLSIIIVSWNVREKLRENLKGIFESIKDGPLLSKGGSVLEFEVFAVDNNSADGSAEMVKNEFPQVNLIANTENLGFGKANNQAIKKAKGKYILFLNPDMKIFKDTLSNIVKWMEENPQASVVGCHLFDNEGNTVKHVRRFPRLADQLAIVLKVPHLFPPALKGYLREDFDYSRAQKVDSVRGAFFMVRNASGMIKDFAERSIDVGSGRQTVPFFDERYFLWFEEVDYCRQIREIGGEVWYTPAAKCVDLVGASFKQVKRGKTQKYFKDSMLKYFKKWQPWWQYLILKMAWPIGEVIVWAGEAVKFKPQAKT